MDVVSIVLIALLVVAVAGAALALAGNRRRAQLRTRFGPEYERAVAEGESRQEAEADLRSRLEEHASLDIRELSEAERGAYAEEWRDVQAEFVDRPDEALVDADALVERLMRDRGYPVDDFERQAGLVSVDHPDVVTHYREAHGVRLRARHGEVATEELRQALVSYRALFAVLLGHEASEADEADDRAMEREETAP